MPRGQDALRVSHSGVLMESRIRIAPGLRSQCESSCPCSHSLVVVRKPLAYAPICFGAPARTRICVVLGTAGKAAMTTRLARAPHAQLPSFSCDTQVSMRACEPLGAEHGTWQRALCRAPSAIGAHRRSP